MTVPLIVTNVLTLKYYIQKIITRGKGDFMNYGITEKLIKNNRPGEKLFPRGIVVHSTDNKGATAENHYNYWNNNSHAKSSAHYVIDWKNIIRLIPENEIAWHAGKSANQRFIGIEICEPFNGETGKFIEAWKRAVWLTASLCIKYNWTTMNNVYSHYGVSRIFRETNHTDPYGYFARFYKSWNIFLYEVDKEIINQKTFKKR